MYTRTFLLILTLIISGLALGQSDPTTLALSQLKKTKRSLTKIRRTLRQEIKNVDEAISILESSHGQLDIGFYGVVSLKKVVSRSGNSIRANHYLRGTLVGRDAKEGLTVDIMRNGKLVGSVQTELSTDGKVIFKANRSNFSIPNVYDLNRDFEIVIQLGNGEVLAAPTTCEGKTEHTLNHYSGIYCKRS